MYNEKLTLRTVIELAENITKLISAGVITKDEAKQLIRGKSFEEIDKK